jgi:hypothetical protein
MVIMDSAARANNAAYLDYGIDSGGSDDAAFVFNMLCCKH